ncbi:hypothetical protein I3760_09G106600 [Carya illinoinensis]|nr:hypothetical protein I3760_09G106600 [Carya illinoinensis]
MDILVCTADPMIEPPALVINTVLYVMAYAYPPQKLTVYLSDDGGSDLTFYAMLEALRFSKTWLPFCKKFKVEPRSPEVYFRTAAEPHGDPVMANDWSSVKKAYKNMKQRIVTVTKLGQIPEEKRKEHKGFSEWNLVANRRDHQTILQIIIDGKDPTALDMEGQSLPTLVYLLARNDICSHGCASDCAAFAIPRVSLRISNGPIILNVDCDMYSSNSESVRDATCFFMDEEKGHEVGYVQFPPSFENLSKNDLYGGALTVLNKVDLPGLDGNGRPFYIGSGCFHRRETLCGTKYSEDCKTALKAWNDIKVEESTATVLENTCKILTSCTFEVNT